MQYNPQPTIQNEFVKIQPLTKDDFETLFAVASDPLIWEQHPNKNRYQRAEFENYFMGAIESGGAFLISDRSTGQVIGSTRFYDLNITEKSILIGYTFIARSHWGSRYNPALKKLLLNHAFELLDTVYFHVGAVNIRSQKAMEKLGAVKIGELDVAYFGEPIKSNLVYKIEKKDWTNY
ncbi:MAG: GNAT family N-acetyltransferase [Aquabacterium sp.]|nr:GNAT family N-acetyltransferase [Ferruginibacter sp.]